MSRKDYSYCAPWPVYALGWSQRPGSFRMAIGSFYEEYANKLKVIQLHEPSGELVRIAEADHQFPITKTMFSPHKSGRTREFLATTGDFLRIWELTIDEDEMDGVQPTTPTPQQPMRFGSSPDSGGDGSGSTSGDSGHLSLRANMANTRRGMGPNAKKDFVAPLTSMDWNEVNPSLCVTSSIDTTCTVWDINTQQAKTQLIAHDKEVYDVAFARGTDVFASVGADGSVRMFDLRALEHSTIIYETPTTGHGGIGGAPENTPLVRIAWNKQDPNYVAAVQQDSGSVLVLDVRVPAIPVTELVNRGSVSVNAIAWAPHSSAHVCSAGDDRQAMIWDVSQLASMKKNETAGQGTGGAAGKPATSIVDPVLVYQAPAEVNQVTWSSVNPEWIAVAYGSTVQALRI
ncbi:WD40-repeat-containing domain protein [Cladochytrium replicatum]|nr:WD40-repeat-containing domain protein [Cladochytrium replicatum]